MYIGIAVFLIALFAVLIIPVEEITSQPGGEFRYSRMWWYRPQYLNNSGTLPVNRTMTFFGYNVTVLNATPTWAVLNISAGPYQTIRNVTIRSNTSFYNAIISYNSYSSILNYTFVPHLNRTVPINVSIANITTAVRVR